MKQTPEEFLRTVIDKFINAHECSEQEALLGIFECPIEYEEDWADEGLTPDEIEDVMDLIRSKI